MPQTHSHRRKAIPLVQAKPTEAAWPRGQRRPAPLKGPTPKDRIGRSQDIESQTGVSRHVAATGAWDIDGFGGLRLEAQRHAANGLGGRERQYHGNLSQGKAVGTRRALRQKIRAHINFFPRSAVERAVCGWGGCGLHYKKATAVKEKGSATEEMDSWQVPGGRGNSGQCWCWPNISQSMRGCVK